MTREPRVWLLQEPRLAAVERNDARAYGEIVPVLNTRTNPAMTPGPAIRKMMNVLRDYRPGDRLLYAPADPVVPLLAGLVLHALGATQEPLEWLRWDRDPEARKRLLAEQHSSAGPPGRVAMPGRYVPITIDTRPLFGFRQKQHITDEGTHHE